MGLDMRATGEAQRHSRKRRLYLVDDHPVTNDGLAQLINFQADLEVCGQATTAASAIAGIDALQPNLAVVDLSLGGSSGLELIKQVSSRHPDLRVLVLSVHDEEIYAPRALRAGARGYVMKQAPTSEVMGAIRTVLAGEIYVSQTMRTRLLEKHLQGSPRPNRTELDCLSDRELEVFELIGHGHATRAIASRLHLSVSTVEAHRAHIKEKLKLRNATQLVRRAVEWVNRRL
jgi:DNA-binding NarL/FixJ family response regulator